MTELGRGATGRHITKLGELDTSHRIILYVERVTVSFGGFKALDDHTLYLDEGELRCIIGPNGAGKTTLMDVITGKIRPDSGQLFFGNTIDLTRLSESEIAQAGIGRKFQRPAVFPGHTVFENLELSLRAPRSVWKTLFAELTATQRGRIEEVLETVGLQERRHLLAGRLSHGEKQWLEIGMLLVQEPKLLLIDEPVAGMSHRETERTAKLLHDLASRHTVVVVDHDMEFVRSLGRKVTVLHEGRVLAEGDMASVQQDPRVVEVYLGA